MVDALATLRTHIDILHNGPQSRGARKTRPGKLDKAKALTGITDAVNSKSVSAALSRYSEIEICLGPPTSDMLENGFLSWNSLAADVLTAMDTAYDEALSGKSSGKSKRITIRPEYMICLKAIFRNAFASGLDDVLRCVVPLFLVSSYQWLSESVLRDHLADDIWQCVRDVLQIDANRAMATSGYIRKWADACFEQISERGPIFHSSQMATNFAHDVLILLARPTSTVDLLTQGKKGVPGSEMKGPDFGYTHLLERSCMLLKLCHSLRERSQRQAQATALRCIATVLKRYGIDTLGSKSLELILNLSVPAVLACWVDRRHIDAALESTQILVRLANCCHPSATKLIRDRIERDFLGKDSAFSVVRSCDDIKSVEVEVASNIFTLEEVIKHIENPECSAVQITAWLKVLENLLSFRIFRSDEDDIDSFLGVRVCAKAAAAATALFAKSRKQRVVSIDILVSACNVIEKAARATARICQSSGYGNIQRYSSLSGEVDVWLQAYRCMLQQLIQVRSANSYKRGAASVAGTQVAEQPLWQCITALLHSELVDLSVFRASTLGGTGYAQTSRSWQSLFSDNNYSLTASNIGFIHLHIAQSGVRDQDGGMFRVVLASRLINVCSPWQTPSMSMNALRMCLSSVLGLARGGSIPCLQFDALKRLSETNLSEMDALDAFYSNFLCTKIESQVSGQMQTKMCRIVSNVTSLNLSKSLFHLQEVFDDTLSRTFSTSSEMRSKRAYDVRFNVDMVSRNLIEKEFVSQIIQFLDASVSIEGSADEVVETWDPESVTEVTHETFLVFLEDRYPWLSDSQTHPLDHWYSSIVHIAFLAVEYINQGRRIGSLQDDDSELASDKDSNTQLECILMLLLPKVSLALLSPAAEQSALLAGLIASCYELCDCANGFRQHSSEAMMFESANSSLDQRPLEAATQTFLSKATEAVAKRVCDILERNAADVVEYIEHLSNSSGGTLGIKRRRSTSQESSLNQYTQTSKKIRLDRSRVKLPSGHGSCRPQASQGVDLWSGESENEDSDADIMSKSEVDSDGSLFINTKRAQTPSSQATDFVPSQDSAVVHDLTDILLFLGKRLAHSGELIQEQLAKCLKTLRTVESRLSPDGPQRSLLGFSVVSHSHLRMRASLWKVLLFLENASADERVAEDVVHVGKMWDKLEQTSSSLVSYYFSELNFPSRKYYPPPKALEDLRLTFLYYSTRALSSGTGKKVFINSLRRGSGSARRTLDVFNAIVDIAEVFRIRDAFRMPRQTRIAYLYFAITLIESMSDRISDAVPLPQSLAPVGSGLSQAKKSVQRAVCRLMSDCDATVRMASAGRHGSLFKALVNVNRKEVESQLQDALPRIGAIAQSGVFAMVNDERGVTPDHASSAGGDESSERSPWKLSRQESIYMREISSCFSDLGSSAKTVTALVSLGEIATAKKDLLPFSISQIIYRVTADSFIELVAYNSLLRLCSQNGYPGPEQLFVIHRRLLLGKMFESCWLPSKLASFPAKLFADVCRHRDGLVYDWMRQHRNEILPFLLVADGKSRNLPNCRAYADFLSESLEDLLSKSAAAVVRIMPMMLTGGVDHIGASLWNNVESILGKESFSIILRDSKDEIQQALLLSISAGDAQYFSEASGTATENDELGFWRDCKDVEPPLFDALVIATALDRLCRTDNPPSIVWGRNDLFGSIFAVCSPQGSGADDSDFSAIRKALLRRQGAVISLLLSVSRKFSGPPGPVHPQSRIDSFMSLATLWRIMGVNMLLESNRRRAFLDLITRGFCFPETVRNAFWLLRDVAVASFGISASDDVPLSDIYLDEKRKNGTEALETSRERRCFELLCVTVSLLTEISAKNSLYTSNKECKSVAFQALKLLMSLAEENGMWTPIALVDAFPASKQFKDLRAQQEKSFAKAFPTERKSSAIIRELEKFAGAELRSGQTGRFLLITLSRLQRLRYALSAENQATIAKLISSEAWNRNDGNPEETLGLLDDVLGFLVSVVRDISVDKLERTEPLSHDDPLNSSASLASRGLLFKVDRQDNLRRMVLQEASWIIGVLGSIHPSSVVLGGASRNFLFEATNSLYGDPIHGLYKALPLLREYVFGRCPIVAQIAYRSLIAVLGTPSGKIFYVAEKDSFTSLAEFRSAARKLSISDMHCEANWFSDVTTGAEISPTLLKTLDEELWIVPRYGGSCLNVVDEWLKRTSAALSCSCKCDALRKLAGICFISPQFSRTVFPYLFMDVISNVPDDERKSISRYIQRNMLEDSSVPVEAVRILVQALDSACQVRLKSLKTNGVGDLFGTSPEKVAQPYLYLADVPYLTVARAAARAGAHFSAVRYANLHLDYACIEHERRTTQTKRGNRRDNRRLSSIVPPETTLESVKGAVMASLEPILLDAAENINEHDMVRGLGQQDGLLDTSSHMALLNANWGRSVGTLDALHSVDDHVTTSGFTNGEDGDETDASKERSGSLLRFLSRELKILRSLIGLGCTNLVVNYWMSLKSRVLQKSVASKHSMKQSNDLSYGYLRKLNELRYAAAWKLGDWESPDILTTPSFHDTDVVEPVVGFHQTLHRSLSALAARRISTVESIVRKGRESQALWLSHMNASESARRVYEVAGRVHILNQVETVANLLLNSESAFTSMENSMPEKVLGNTSSFNASASNDFHVHNSQRTEVGMEMATSSFRASADAAQSLLGILYNPESKSNCLASSLKDTDKIGSSLDENLGMNSIALDFRVALARCFGDRSIIARVSADVSGTLFLQGGSGAWARSAAALGTAKSFSEEDVTNIDIAEWHLQEAVLRWTSSQDGRAKQSALVKVKTLIENELGGSFKLKQSKSISQDDYSFHWNMVPGDQSRIARVRADACQLASLWSSEMRADEPMALFRCYLKMALAAYKEDYGVTQRGLTHYFLAGFADSQIGNIENYRKSKTYSQMVLAIEEADNKIRKLQEMCERGKHIKSSGSGRGRRSSRSQLSSGADKSLVQELEAHIRDQKKRVEEDRQRLNKLEEKFKEWQLLACQHYASSIRDGNQHDLRGAFRLVALWLDAGVMRDQITEELTIRNAQDSLCINVPLAKLLPLAPQLCSRLAFSDSSLFQRALSKTLEAMAKKFPSHCLWQLLALSNLTRVAANKEKFASFYKGDPDKKNAADEILRNVEKSGSLMVSQMKLVADAYIELSEIQAKNTPKINISKSSLCQMRDLMAVPVPTVGLPLYGNSDENFEAPHISYFKDQASVCNGLSKPLKITCVGSDGKQYFQMVKGKDDLRGDAVMEQIFTILNELLRSDPSASRRNLFVRTYRILPLSPFSGVLQFVKGTSQFKEVLVEDRFQQSKGGALHERYRPHDIPHNVIWAEAARYKSRHDMNKKIAYIASVWNNFLPAFRYFFLEQWPDPSAWYVHQLAYTRSVAVMSIVGFILGLGDRHLSNILLDTVSGEVVHIDFGIAFEQGKLLPTPERMPFRLTRDLVDGFGITGVDGVYRHCSEITLAVMRKNKDVLCTVCEVLLHDPMYNWALTPEAVLKEQLEVPGERVLLANSEDFLGESREKKNVGAAGAAKEESDKGSKEAQRALRRIQEKLDGLEDTEKLSIEAHVARLIDEARSFNVLASVFPGWTPWL